MEPEPIWNPEYPEGFREILKNTAVAGIPNLEQCLLGHLLNYLPDRIYYKDLDSRFILGNGAFLQMFGISNLESLMGRTDFDFFSAEHAQAAFDDEQEIIRSGVPKLNMEEKETWPGGRVTWCVTTKGPLRDHAGRIIGTFGISRDITAQKAAQAAERASEQRFRALFDSSPDPIALSRPADGTLLMVNKAWCELSGYSESETLGRTSLSLGIWPEPDDRTALIAGLRTDPMTGPVELTLRSKHGTKKKILVSIKLIRVGAEDYSLFMGKDVTDRHRIESALRESEARARALVKAIPDLIFTFDAAGTYLDVSASDPGLLLLSAEQLIGRKVSEVLSEAVAGQFLSAIGAALGSKAVQELEYALPFAGVEKCFEARIAPSSANRVIAIVRDVSQRKLVEEERHRFEERAAQVQKLEALGVLVAGVAHTLNNVLAIIMGTASLREPQATAAVDRQAFGTINRVSRRGSEVVKSLIQFGNPVPPTQAPVELVGLVREVQALLEHTTRNGVEIRALGEGPCWILGDAGSVSTALVNLCFNSLEAMPGGGLLTLRTAGRGDREVEILVEDSGTGMPPKVLAHALEPFFTTKDGSIGAGLGLSLTYGVVKAHGGALEITSQVGEGTTVSLRFPRIPAPERAGSAPGAMPPVSLGKVLLVDDEEDVRFLMARMLRKVGVEEVETVAGGAEALGRLQAGAVPDVIILDQNMPGMDGVQTLAKIRGLCPLLPVLISSGQPDIEDWECFKMPKVAVISKPFTVAEIQARLARFAREAEFG